MQGGRTNRVWRYTDGGASFVLKLYRDPAPNPLFDNDPEREIRTLKALRGTGLAPELLAAGQSSEGTWLLYSFLQGVPWKTDVALVANLLSKVHVWNIEGFLRKGPNGSAEVESQTQAILAECADSEIRSKVMRMRPTGHVPGVKTTALVHGDPVAGNIIVGPESAVLIDWQCPVIGDPTEDLAVFLSPAMQFLYRGTALSSDECNRFLAAYPDERVAERYRAMRPWYHRRMAAYCLWQADRGNKDYARVIQLELDELGG